MPVSKKRKPKTKRRIQHQWVPTKPTDVLNNPKTRILDMNDAPDELKLSAKLITIMEPWMEEVPVEILADCASLAWNACVSGEDDYYSVDFLRSGIAHADKEQIALIEQLKTRKKELFPNDMRTIVRMQVIMDENGDPRINVASELKPTDMVKMLARLADME